MRLRQLLIYAKSLVKFSQKNFKSSKNKIHSIIFIVESVDSYLSEKVDQIETNYPSITKPTDQVYNKNKNNKTMKLLIYNLFFFLFFKLTANAISQAKDIYDKTVNYPIETLSTIKDKTVTSLNSISSNKVRKLNIFCYYFFKN